MNNRFKQLNYVKYFKKGLVVKWISHVSSDQGDSSIFVALLNVFVKKV